MPLVLNKLDNDIIMEFLDSSIARLQKMFGPLIASAGTEQYYHVVGTNSLDIGLIFYQQERKQEEIRKYLSQAGEAMIREHKLRTYPESNTYRHIWSFKQAIHLTVCFCTPQWRPNAAIIKEWQYRHPSDPDDDTLSLYLEALKPFIMGENLNENICQRVGERCLLDTASKEEYLLVLPEVQGLMAIEQKNLRSWETSIDALIKTHEKEAKRGEYRRDIEAFICLPALMLVQLGQEKGMTCKMKSPYLPLTLLN